MSSSNDPGGRSGIFPRVRPNAPVPSQADSTVPIRPLPSEHDLPDGDVLAIHEDEDPARYDDDTDPAGNDPENDA